MTELVQTRLPRTSCMCRWLNQIFWPWNRTDGTGGRFADFTLGTCTRTNTMDLCKENSKVDGCSQITQILNEKSVLILLYIELLVLGK